MPSIKIYYDAVSPPARAVLLTARALNITVEVENVSLRDRENLSESFVNLNCTTCVPIMVEDAFVLTESRAIACYLASKYGEDSWYPKDLKKRALVDQRLYFDATFLFHKMKLICDALVAGEEIRQDMKDNVNLGIKYMEKFLSESQWLAGDSPTIADISVYASFSSLLAFDWDLNPFPNILSWLKNCSALPGADENLEGGRATAKLLLKK